MDTRMFYKSQDGFFNLVIEIFEDTIIGISFIVEQNVSEPSTSLEREIAQQLDSYFAGKNKEFDLPFFATGTVFQLMVWEEVMKIPYGTTITYSELAAKIDKPKAARAVGRALHQNPIPILIPCHRVIGSDSCLKGYGGGLDKKEKLLNLERSVIL